MRVQGKLLCVFLCQYVMYENMISNMPMFAFVACFSSGHAVIFCGIIYFIVCQIYIKYCGRLST